MPSRLTLFFLCCAVLVRAADPTELSARLGRLSASRTVAADFVQTRRVSGMDMELEIRGSMISERNGRLRWQVDSPLRSVTVIDREKLLHFDRETGKLATIHERDLPWLGVMRECLNDWLSGDPGRLSRRFELSSPDGRILRLLPKTPELRTLYEFVELHFDSKFEKLTLIRIGESSGDRLDIRFLNVRNDPAVPEDIWRMPPR